jgi:hypothetical protein
VRVFFLGRFVRSRGEIARASVDSAVDSSAHAAVAVEGGARRGRDDARWGRAEGGKGGDARECASN